MCVCVSQVGNIWTAAKWLSSRGVASVVAAALQLPPRTAGDSSHFAYVKNLQREQVTEARARAWA